MVELQNQKNIVDDVMGHPVSHSGDQRPHRLHHHDAPDGGAARGAALVELRRHCLRHLQGLAKPLKKFVDFLVVVQLILVFIGLLISCTTTRKLIKFRIWPNLQLGRGRQPRGLLADGVRHRHGQTLHGAQEDAGTE